MPSSATAQIQPGKYTSQEANRGVNQSSQLDGQALASDSSQSSFGSNGLSMLHAVLVSIIFMVIILATLIGNSLVIVAVVIVRKLHTQDNANNLLIVSLAVSDLLVGVFAMPFAFYLELSEENKY